MNLSKIARIVALCLVVSATALASFAAPPPPQPCSCEYCSTGSPGKSCVWNGATIGCGEFLSFTTCLA